MQQAMYHDNQPLANRMRPKTLEHFYGQDKIVGKDSMLRQAIENDNLPSMIFWGPPGCGKTTLAHIIANSTNAEFVPLSAVSSGKKDLLLIITKAKESLRLGVKTILFIDEIHRWNKAQQDALLPFVEQGTIILIGATTENPSFEVRSALLSRSRVVVFEKFQTQDLVKVLQRAMIDKVNGYGGFKFKIKDEDLEMIAKLGNGDPRTVLNVFEYLVTANEKNSAVVFDKNRIKEAFQKTHLMYDKDGEEHYNIISALHKSMRGSDADAALYWLTRMLEAGEDPLYIARRIIRFAAEDIGLENSQALNQAVAAFQACHILGMPECDVVLAQAVVYMSKCKKSNKIYSAYNKAKNDVQRFGNLAVPKHLRNAPTKLMKELDYGKNYKYSPNFNYREQQEYFPSELKNQRYL